MGAGSGPDPAFGAAQQPGERRITIADVAARAGVSKSAVSFVFNGRRGLSQVTTDRIVRAARELGWRPNSRARALSARRPRSAGVVIRRGDAGVDSDLAGFLHGLGDALAATGAVLVVRVVTTGVEEQEVYSGFVRESQVDVVLLLGMRIGDERPDVLTALGLPFVVADDAGASGADAEGMRLAIRHLHALGHRRVALVADGSLVPSARRIAVFVDESRLLGLDVRVFRADSSPPSVAAATVRLLDGTVPPTAILYECDVLAATGMQVAQRRGMAVPEELSVIGLDDGLIARVTTPSLSAVHSDADAWGRACGRLLADRVGGGEPHELALAPSELVARGSTGPPPHPLDHERSR
ncbi:LacI family DNA-binding transcriptional regulator [Cryocola sp. 340MFSha3.1]|uniref:LacI family DNA-binding transcriptional regulator n=1 Tax=Cryocola sp. 340MFSha3.1 TaxID=1169145 RepID=UPI0003712923|nr:LacI family DNA-binding transcriptional regulator [Cryocola sp. 340MFSha3.1]